MGSLRNTANHTTQRPCRAILTKRPWQPHHHHLLQEPKVNRGALQCPASWMRSSTLDSTSQMGRDCGWQGSSIILRTLLFPETTTQGTKHKATLRQALPM